MIEVNNIDELHSAIIDACKDNVTINSDRPYDGQSHTFQGERGKTIVENLTIRDICDCFVLGLMEASGVEELYTKVQHGTACYDDVYSIPDNIDPIAAVQNAACRIENMMCDSNKERTTE